MVDCRKCGYPIFNHNEDDVCDDCEFSTEEDAV